MCVEKERIEKKREKKTECQKPLVFLFVEFDGGEEDQEKKKKKIFNACFSSLPRVLIITMLGS